MSSPSVASYTSTIPAAATLFLVPGAIDRLAEGRRLAAAQLGATDHDLSLALRGAHPDLIELAPPAKKERIGIDQVREVVRLTQFSPVHATRKVCLVARAELLTPEAANALLKTMEEPPRDAAFVLLAEHPSDLLPTVVSRCRTVRVPPTPRDALVRRLADAGYSDADAAWLSCIALRDGDLSRLVESPLDVGAFREAASRDLRAASVTELIGAAVADEPIRRDEALRRIVDRTERQDPELLTVGVRTLANQDRDTLGRFLQELLLVGFERIRSSSRSPSDSDRLRTLCRSLDRAARSLAVYGPPEAVLLSSLLSGDDGDAQ